VAAWEAHSLLGFAATLRKIVSLAQKLQQGVQLRQRVACDKTIKAGEKQYVNSIVSCDALLVNSDQRILRLPFNKLLDPAIDNVEIAVKGLNKTYSIVR
jgi:hypothetical protein